MVRAAETQATVLVTGATGFIGRRLCERLMEGNCQVIALSRSPERARAVLPEAIECRPWPPEESPQPVDAVVHLVGEPVTGRWSARKRRAIHDSRVLGTQQLVAAMKGWKARTLIAASAIGIYGDREEEELDEQSRPGDTFLAEVCCEWEAAARSAAANGVRVASVRLGIVLGRDGGALPHMLAPFKAGLGGPLGSGRQWMSWVHIDDAVGIFSHALRRPEIMGAVNAVAPNPVRNAEFAQALGAALHRPARLPVPAAALRMAVGGFADEVLASQRVLPRRALETGYEFAFPVLDAALSDILSSG